MFTSQHSQLKSLPNFQTKLSTLNLSIQSPLCSLLPEILGTHGLAVQDKKNTLTGQIDKHNFKILFYNNKILMLISVRVRVRYAGDN